MKKGSTKKALVTSIVSTCASVTMLAGATFAWFTDTANTGVNKIQAGNLDIALVDANGKNVEGRDLNWKTADKRAQKDIFWEPGATYDLETVKVVNEGDLGLKYKVVITGIDGDAELNQAIEWKINGEGIESESKLAAGTSKEITISGTMKTDAGNEYQGKSIDGIAITVVATQDTVEKDSDDNLYDIDAKYEYDEFKVVANAQDTQNAVAEGGVAIFGSDISIEEPAGSAYGKTGLAQINGGVIDGNGKTLSVTGANTTWDSGIYTQGGTIKNLTINGAFKGILIDAKDDVMIDNVTIDKTCYTMNADEGRGHKLIVKNSTLNGWTSFAETISEASFTNCKFGKGTGAYKYAYLRPYTNTTITNCEFSEGFELDSTETNKRGKTITLKNCKVGGTLVTQQNVVSLLGEDAQYVTVEN